MTLQQGLKEEKTECTTLYVNDSATRAEGGKDRMYVNDSATRAEGGKDRMYVNDSACNKSGRRIGGQNVRVYE